MVIKRKLSFIILFLFLISFISVASSEMISSPAGVTYDSDLLKAFENKNFANSLIKQEGFIGLEIINDQTWARVSVTLRDNSGIIVTGTKEERRELVLKKVEWTTGEIEIILKDYLGEGFILRGNSSSSFGALVTEERFNQLINDTRIDSVNWISNKPELIDADTTTKHYLIWIYLSIFIVVLLAIFFIFYKKMHSGKNKSKRNKIGNKKT